MPDSCVTEFLGICVAAFSTLMKSPMHSTRLKNAKLKRVFEISADPSGMNIHIARGMNPKIEPGKRLERINLNFEVGYVV